MASVLRDVKIISRQRESFKTTYASAWVFSDSDMSAGGRSARATTGTRGTKGAVSAGRAAPVMASTTASVGELVPRWQAVTCHRPLAASDAAEHFSGAGVP